MQYQEFCEQVARKASKMILEGYHNNKKISIKEGEHIVTETDLAVNKMVLEEIRSTYPDHNVLGEEESYLENNSQYLWLCDPIDGTIPFAMGLPVMTFSLALTQNGRPIAAIVAIPIEGKLFYAEKGCGTWIGEQQQHVKPLDIVNIGFCQWAAAPYRMPGLYEIFTDNDLNPLDIASIAIMGTLVCKGTLSAVVFAADMQYDTPAIDLLITEAGGRTSDFAGNEVDYRKPIYGFIGSNGECHEKILEIIKEKRNDL